jgi:hypothetical protein
VVNRHSRVFQKPNMQKCENDTFVLKNYTFGTRLFNLFLNKHANFKEHTLKFVILTLKSVISNPIKMMSIRKQSMIDTQECD